MTKLIWDRGSVRSILDSDYYTDPKQGFDKHWHTQQAHKKSKAEKERQTLGTHANHELERIQLPSGPHSGKLICKTCNNKFIKWLPKSAF